MGRDAGENQSGQSIEKLRASQVNHALNHTKHISSMWKLVLIAKVETCLLCVFFMLK